MSRIRVGLRTLITKAASHKLGTSLLHVGHTAREREELELGIISCQVSGPAR